MVKSKSNKMHLQINNDVELDIKNASISKRNRKSRKSSAAPIRRKRKVSNQLNQSIALTAKTANNKVKF